MSPPAAGADDRQPGRERGYDPQLIEPRWQERWEEADLFTADDASERPPFYALHMFPYPSGDLHMGHVEAFSLADAVARYQRLRGYEVMNPIGWDSFGLPAENAAIQRGVDPKEWTYANIETHVATMRRLGFAWDWSRRLHTSDPEYYRWTQWIFLQLYCAGWAYRDEALVNWCPSCSTVLANEQVIDGHCERCGAEIVKKPLTQWFFRITEFAQRLLDDMAELEGHWPDRVLTLQRNWIGRTEGAEVTFRVTGPGASPDEAEPIVVYTTRPDTLYGATFFVVAPEHPRAREWARAGGAEEALDEFLDRVRTKSDVEREAAGGEKDGVRLGVAAINPVNGERLPVFAADYVLMGAGTGAIMAVPAHDQRDLDFARAHDLPVRVVVQPEGEAPLDAATMTEAAAGEGTTTNSGPYDGLPWPETKQRLTADLEAQGLGAFAVNYRLRDWLVSRQRFWGAPIPIIHCGGCGLVPVPDEELPVQLPEPHEVDLRPEGESPLATSQDWVRVPCPECGGAATRDTDTMDTFVDSSWYYLRYCSPGRDDVAFDPGDLRRWMPVDQYTGGIEHAILHLLYSRFFTKVLHDLGHVDFVEPFTRLKSQGMVLNQGAAMSKSKGNVVEPKEVVAQYGADTLRATMLFAGPIEDDIDWADVSTSGMHKWLGRFLRLVDDHVVGRDETDASGDDALRRATHRAIAAVGEDFEGFKYNTALAKLMALTNEVGAAVRERGASGQDVEDALAATAIMLSPIAPHVAEEAWHRLGRDGFVAEAGWPSHDPALLVEETVDVPVQVDGKVRGTMTVGTASDEETAVTTARELDNVARHLAEREIVKTIWVPDRMLNFVTKPRE
ncbi:leucine--tRNA ligase [Egibacter rhizosphaerae]|uniref:Leucine--tRNA ligase n=1 Tax=Egibacter rhizosphaerae TaxID=1670831 RepID=A0A411YL26_9ACTN|nr:leucine--tRNA ligase [Egibacter rhizosphaerae]